MSISTPDLRGNRLCVPADQPFFRIVFLRDLGFVFCAGFFFDDETVPGFRGCVDCLAGFLEGTLRVAGDCAGMGAWVREEGACGTGPR